VRSDTFQVGSGGRIVVDLTDRVVGFVREIGGDGLVHVFAPHATAGLALIETGSGSESDLEALLARTLPRDDRYAHRHGSVGHGGDHLLPAFVAPSLVIPVLGGALALGTWQSVVLVDPNRDNNTRTIRMSFVPA
jgi:secondary thiamine-phosphate synthase enzyme